MFSNVKECNITELPLLDAKALGYKAGILHASGMGESAYRSLGFEEYCTIGQYIILRNKIQTPGVV